MNTNYALAFMIVGILASSPAIAGKPSSDGSDSVKRGPPERTHGKQQDATEDKPSSAERDRRNEPWAQREHTRDEQSDRNERWDRDGRSDRNERNEHFGDQHRSAVRDYYSNDFRRGHCPPGLAKKQNGCMPPGLAKKWTVGQQLPRNVIFHNLPQALATQLGQPPAGHRYVQVQDDILLITSRTGKVIDAISVLGNQ
jgi:Ni/Co efflux regulator RcnB